MTYITREPEKKWVKKFGSFFKRDRAGDIRCSRKKNDHRTGAS